MLEATKKARLVKVGSHNLQNLLNDWNAENSPNPVVTRIIQLSKYGNHDGKRRQ